MNRSNPSTFVGGGEMNRATSSVESIARSDGASESRSSRSVTIDPLEHRERLPPVARRDLLRRRRHHGVHVDHLLCVTERHLLH